MNKILTTLLRPREWIAKLLLVIIGIAFLATGLLGYLSPIITVLDSDALAFQISETRISAYLAVKAIIAITLLFWVASLFSDLSEKKIKTLRKIKASNRALITKAIQIFIYFIAALIALDVLGIDLTALTVLGGAIGIGIGFGGSFGPACSSGGCVGCTLLTPLLKFCILFLYKSNVINQLHQHNLQSLLV